MSGGDEPSPAPEVWLDSSDLFPSVHGYAEATALLNDPRLHAAYHDLFVAAGASQGRAGEAGQRSLLSLNGEEHKRLRSEIAWGFRPRSVDRIRPFARQTAEELLRDIPDAQPFEFMSHFAKPYIERTTGEYIGFPRADLETLKGPLDVMSEAVGDLHNRAREFDGACTELVDYAMEALLARRATPSDDVLGYLAQKIESHAIDELFAANLVVTLLSAGLEPTIFQLGLMMEEFSKLADVWDGIAADDSQLPAILEELLRLRSTNQGVVRCLHADIAHHSVQFQKGSNVLVSIAGANHDARRFKRPEAFDLEANKGNHLAFGFGPHHCLGAPLVRAQLQEAVQILTKQLCSPKVLAVTPRVGQGLTGPLEMTVEFMRRT